MARGRGKNVAKTTWRNTNGRGLSSSAEVITKIFQERLVKEGWRWKDIPIDIIDFYSNEFQKHCAWLPEIHAQVRKAWLTKAGEQYRDMCCKLRKRSRPAYIEQDVWDEWIKEWNAIEYKAMCERLSKNRKTEKAGEGNGISRHTGGSNFI